MEFSNTLIRVILLVIVLVVVAVPLRGFFISEILPFFRSDFSQQTPDVQNRVQNDFNALAANIDKCISSADTNCVCKNVIPNFPNTFYSNGILKFSLRQNTKMEYFWKGTKAEFNHTFENALVSVVQADLTGLGDKFREIKKIDNGEIVFSSKESYPKMDDLFVASPHLLKTYQRQAVFIAVQSLSIDYARDLMNKQKECA